MSTAQPRHRRTLCAICDDTNQTTKLCAACRADPANEGWSEEWEGVDFTADLDAVQTSESAPRLADLMGEPPRNLEQRIVDLHVGGEDAERDPSGRFRHNRLSSRQIAVRLGCSHQFVLKVIGRFERGAVKEA